MASGATRQSNCGTGGAGCRAYLARLAHLCEPCTSVRLSYNHQLLKCSFSVVLRGLPLHPLAAYLDRVHEIHTSKHGTPELSYRAALENLLNAVGARLDPAVRVTAELADTGAGHPDFGLFEAKSNSPRGVVEVKPVKEDVPDTADGAQVARYWKH